MEKKLLKKIAKHIIGWIFIFLGIIGCFLPILQGILFLSVGTIILAPEVPFFQNQLNKLRDHYPNIFYKARLIIRHIRRRTCKRSL